MLDRDQLAFNRVTPAGPAVAGRRCVSSGIPISGCTIRIIDDPGLDLPEGRVGEIAIQSVSLFDGYRNNPKKTAEVLVDGWYLSGDYGFRHEGELYVTGRRKDVLIVAGKNLYPEDIEDAVARGMLRMALAVKNPHAVNALVSAYAGQFWHPFEGLK